MELGVRKKSSTGAFTKLAWPQLPYATVARPRQIMGLVWLPLNRPCAATKVEGLG
jgi:hypothetical protein